MLYKTPPLKPHRTSLAELDSLRSKLGTEGTRATPWAGQLRRQARAATARSSTAIEGYSVSAALASDLVEGRTVATDRDQRAVAGYALAMHHVAVLDIEAHLAQARERLSTLDRAAKRWAVLEALVEARGWPDRLAIALEQSLFDGLDRASFCAEAGVSPATASADLRRLLDAGLVNRKGRGPDTRYIASAELVQAVESR